MHARKQQVAQPITSPVVRTSAGLRNALFDELDALRNGTSDPPRANSVSKLAAQVVATVNMELEVHRMAEKLPGAEKATRAIAAVPLG